MSKQKYSRNFRQLFEFSYAKTLDKIFPKNSVLDEPLELFFEEISNQRILSDSKTLVDLVPKYSARKIARKYQKQRSKKHFYPKKFIEDNFCFVKGANPSTSKYNNILEYISQTWDDLERKNIRSIGTLVGLPHSYIVPGGRFNEQFYWDSYFTMLGLFYSKRYDLMQNMCENFIYLLDKYGYIPNGNRIYLLGRSQPPVFYLMVELLCEVFEKKSVLKRYLPYLQIEYDWWTSGDLETKTVDKHIVKMPDGEILNRYFDEFSTPRPESKIEDEVTAKSVNDRKTDVFANLRAGAESGWDFSSRWLNSSKHLTAIKTKDIIAVDLNCLLAGFEDFLARSYREVDDKKAEIYKNKSQNRKNAIMKYCYDDKLEWLMDYDFEQGVRSGNQTLAGVFGMFCETLNDYQMKKMAINLEKNFLKSGGLVTTLEVSSEQWDSPNGWPPLQWVAFVGLKKYGYNELANEISSRWCSNVIDSFKTHKKLVEKYDVVNCSLGFGGEYVLQDGFGWTNGVTLAFLKNSQDKANAFKK